MRSFRLLGFSLPRKPILTHMLFCYFLKLPILTHLTILVNPSTTKNNTHPNPKLNLWVIGLILPPLLTCILEANFYLTKTCS
ncbi:hypothetical protein HanXRQr2_Chr02g0080401 [Helianthus annuus]|uniref:Uncharacterized protein n=1 Tax=Helianthus annuus TaxID=4232 RepID=A0A9K3JSC4_HELAN|nr:hypothetical protein HanXRQr2_Chr02g0080401 [Helianthus annuus]